MTKINEIERLKQRIDDERIRGTIAIIGLISIFIFGAIFIVVKGYEFEKLQQENEMLEREISSSNSVWLLQNETIYGCNIERVISGQYIIPYINYNNCEVLK